MSYQLLNKPQVTGGGAVVVLGDDVPDNGRTGQWAINGNLCDRTYTVRLKVQMLSPLTGPIAIIQGLGVKIGDTYKYPLASSTTETDTGSFLQSISLGEFTEDGRQCIAQLDYGPFDVVHELGQSNLDKGVIDPTEMAPKVLWSAAKYELYKTEDRTEDPKPKPFINTAGDPLLNPPKTEETRPVLEFVRNETQYDETWASTWKDTVNKDVFLGYPPNTVKIKEIKGERFYAADWGYLWQVSYQFEFRDDPDGKGYTYVDQNLGYRQKVNGTGPPQQIMIAGQTITDAVPLRADGAYAPQEDPHPIEFKLFADSEFASLNIPEELFTQEQ